MWHLRRLLRCVFTHNFTRYGVPFKQGTTWHQTRVCKDCGRIETRKVSSLLVSDLNVPESSSTCGIRA